jgi:hypothetical protein
MLNPPAGLTRRSICALSGQAPTAACTELVGEWLDPATPLATCALHRRAAGGIETMLPAEYDPWLRQAGWQTRAGGGDGSATNAPNSPISPTPFRIESPRDGERFYLAHDLPADVQTIALRANGAPAGAAVTWMMDGTPAGTGTEVRWALRPGAHQIAARAGSARTAPVRIEVLDSSTP